LCFPAPETNISGNLGVFILMHTCDLMHFEEAVHYKDEKDTNPILIVFLFIGEDVQYHGTVVSMKGIM
jgi:hypothetical protein